MPLNASQVPSNNEFAMFNKQNVESRQSFAVNQPVGLLVLAITKLGRPERFAVQV